MATAYDSGDNESIFTRRSQRRKRNAVTFAYDVGVNVLANLIAAAVIVYVLQRSGTVAFNPNLVRIASVVLGALAVLLINGGGIAYILSANKKRQTRKARKVIISGVAIVILVALWSAFVAYKLSNENPAHGSDPTTPPPSAPADAPAQPQAPQSTAPAPQPHKPGTPAATHPD